MPYVPSTTQKIKDVIKTQCSKLSKKNATFKKVYSRFIANKRTNRYEQYTNQPIEENLVILESFQARRYADSPRAIYEYLMSHEKYNDLRFIWAFRGSIMDDYMWLNDNDRTTVIRFGSDEYYETYAVAKYWINNSRFLQAMVPRDGQIVVQTWHGTPLKRIGCDIEVEGDCAKYTKEDVIRQYTTDSSKYTYLISPSKFCTEKFTTAFGLDRLDKKDVFIEEGYPRNDFLNTFTEEDVKRVKTAIGIPEGKKVILYAPTWRDNQHIVGTGYVYENTLDLDRLQQELGDEYVLLYRTHYFVANEMNLGAYEGFVYDVCSYEDINDLYIISDILITDYSSVFFDYGILKRPILFYMYDLKYYQDTVRGFYISLDELPGPIVEEQDELISKLKTVDEWAQGKEYMDKYKTFSSKFTYLDDGHAAERVVKRVFGR